MQDATVISNFISKIKQRRNMALLILFAGMGLTGGMLLGLIVQGVSLLIPFYYANLITGLLIVANGVAGTIFAVIKRFNMKQAALYADSFGGKERLSTALENVENDSEMAQLQRDDAICYLEANRELIKVAAFPGWKRMGLFVAVAILLIASIMIPSRTREIAKERHEIKKEAKETIEEIKENIELLEDLTQTDLSEEQTQQLQEMIEMLQASAAEYKQAMTKQNMQTAAQKLDYKYQTMSVNLANMASQLQEQKESGTQEEQEKTQEIIEQVQEAEQQISQSGGQATASGTTANPQGSGQSNNGQSGQSQNGNSQSGNGDENQGASGDGQGDGNQGGNESGTGSGSGDGEGQGGGQSSGGSSQGAGSGRGEGTTDSTHDYISIPNNVGNDDALTGIHDGDETDSFYRAQNGLAWEGEHVSYEKVIGEYKDRAYEGLSTGKYPSGMESVIKDYFSSFNE